jgi:hypothetical protein
MVGTGGRLTEDSRPKSVPSVERGVASGTVAGRRRAVTARSRVKIDEPGLRPDTYVTELAPLSPTNAVVLNEGVTAPEFHPIDLAEQAF